MKRLFQLLIVVLVSAGTSIGVYWVLRLQDRDARTQAAAHYARGEQLTGLDSFGRTGPAGEPRRVVAALGRIEPEGELIEIGGGTGGRVARLMVAAGDGVERDAVLAYLESHEAIAAERDTIAAQIEEAEARLRAETAYAESLVSQAEVALEEAELLGPLRVAAREAEFRAAESQLEQARAELRRLEGAGEVVSGRRAAQQGALVRDAEAQRDAAEAVLAQAQASRTLDVSKARADLNAARAKLEQVRSATMVGSLKSQLAAAEVRLSHAAVRAPTAGRVVSIETRPGEQVEGRPILVLADTQAMYAVAEVYETDVTRVRVGQRASVSSAALPEPLTGTVDRVGSVVDSNSLLHLDPAAARDARVVEVHVRLDNPEAVRDLMMLQVDVRIDVEAAPDLRPSSGSLER